MRFGFSSGGLGKLQRKLKCYVVAGPSHGICSFQPTKHCCVIVQVDWVQPVPAALPVRAHPEHGHHGSSLPGGAAHAAAHWQYCRHAECLWRPQPRPGQEHQQSHQGRPGIA